MGAVRARKFAANDERKAIEYRLRLRETLLAARTEIAPAKYDEHLAWLKGQTEDRLPLHIVRKAVGYHYLNGIQKAPPLPLATELQWVASRLAADANHISRFRKLADALEEAFWAGDKRRVRAVALVIGRIYGQSLWLIENKIATIQHFEGLEAQKRYAELVKSKWHRSILSYMVHFLSAKNEPSATPLRFAETLGARIDRSRYSKFIKIYLKYRLVGHRPSSSPDLASILRAVQSHGVCDLYETFIALAQHLAASRVDGRVLPELRSAVAKLSAIEDWRLDKLAAVLGVPRGLGAIQAGEFEAQDSLLRGDMKSAYRAARRCLKRRPADVSQAAIAAYAIASVRRSKSPIPSSSPWSFVIDRLATLFAKGDGFEKAVTDLLKFSRNFGSLSVARGLIGVCLREGLPRSSSSEDADRIESMSRRYLDPIDFLAFHDDRAQSVIDGLGQSDAITIKFAEATRFGSAVPQGVGVQFSRVAEASYKARIGDLTSAYTAIAPNLNGPTDYLWLLSSKLAAEYLITSNDYAGALGVIANVCATNERASNCLPIPEIVEGAQWHELEPFSGDLSLSIAIDQFWKHTNDDEAATFRKFSYEEFLARAGVERPTQLSTISDKFDSRQLVYFFRNVCVQTVMEMSVDIASSRGLDEERRDICSLLCDLDPENTGDYQREIFEINNKLLIQDGLKVVDSSRIYVDPDGIYRRADKELHESFARYRDLVEAGIGVADDFETVIRSLIRQDSSSKNYFVVPSNEADDLLVSMIFALKEAFLFDAAHGLDSYLSKRVRHGSIPNYLRSPVENAKLITQRATGADTYRTNEYWLKKLGPMPEADVESVQSCFVAFAKSFDAMIIELKDELLQLNTADHPRGLFEIPLTTPAIHFIRSAIQSELSFANFVRSCFDIFWTFLEPSLAATRSHLKEVTKAQVAQAFDKLRADLLVATESDAELSMAIGEASTDVQRRAESIAEWFNRPDGRQSSQTYTLEQVIDIAVESALNSLRAFKPRITKSIKSEYRIPVNGLVMVNEIIWVALENVHLRSGVEGNPWVRIEAAVLPDEEVLSVKVFSEVSPGIRCAETEQKLAAMRDSISNGSFRDLVRKEGNSGFFKIASQVSESPRGRIKFGFDDHETFCIEVDLGSIVYNGPGGIASEGRADADIVG